MHITQTVQRVERVCSLIDDTKSEASDAVIPLPKVTCKNAAASIVSSRRLSASRRATCGRIMTSSSPRSTGRPIEPRYLNTHFDQDPHDGSVYPTFGCTTSGIRS